MPDPKSPGELPLPRDVLEFWFSALTPRQWFAKDPALDKLIAQRFGDTLEAASRAELWHWRDSRGGRLAEVIVLDQFSRNIHRDTPQAFSQDPLALALSQEAIASGADQQFDNPQRQFLYMPFMHSESAAIHEQAEALFARPGLEDAYRSELRHKAIIDRFGRYPHRNAVLGRVSTEEELAFLAQPGSGF